LAGVAALLVAALVVVLILSLDPGRTPASNSTTTSHPSTTTSAPTATTSPPTSAQALASLVGEVATGVTAHTVSTSVGQSISTLAQQAVTDGVAGRAQQAANDLQQAASAIANGTRNGTIAPSEGAVLQADLSTLASSLGLSAAATAPTTTPTTAPGSGGGNGDGNKGKGKGD
jgi:hypothetical protein